jgi:hypothetical protein
MQNVVRESLANQSMNSKRVWKRQLTWVLNEVVNADSLELDEEMDPNASVL